MHWDTPIPPLSVNIFFYFLTKPVVGWAPPQVEIFHTQKSSTKNAKLTKWWFFSPEYWVPSPHRNWHKPSDREFILNWVCPAEIDHTTLCLLRAFLESLSHILYCYLFQFLVARECGPSDTLSSATDGKGAKRRGGKILRHFPQNSWHFPTRNCNITCLGAANLISLSSKKWKGRRRFCYKENNVMIIISIKHDLGDHVFNYGPKLATRVTKFREILLHS